MKNNAEIKLYEKNAKIHTDKQLELLAKIVAEIGWRQSVEVNQQGTIVVGHGRYLAWKKYKDKYKLPDIWVVDDTGKTVMGKHDERPLTEQQEMMWRLADNQVNAMTGLDMALVVPELKLLDDDMLDLSGFDKDLIIEPDEKDDEVPEVPEEPKSKLGDLYELGNHRVLCGDSTKQEDVERLMDGKLADMVMSDPPYNVEYTGGSTNENKRDDSYKDKWTDEDYVLFLSQTYKNAFDASKGESAMMIWFASAKMRQIMDGFEKSGWVSRTLIVWNKLKAHYGALGAQYKHKMEPLWYCHKKGKSPKWFGATNETTVWDFEQPRVNELHPTMKPVEVYIRCIKNHTKKDDIVYETFLGSGTTLIASEKTGRICYGMELDPKYIDVIVQRYVEYTGKNKIIKNGKEEIWT